MQHIDYNMPIFICNILLFFICSLIFKILKNSGFSIYLFFVLIFANL